MNQKNNNKQRVDIYKQVKVKTDTAKIPDNMATVQCKFIYPCDGSKIFLSGDIVELEKGEIREPYEIISLDLDTMKSYTPDECIRIGQVLIDLGKDTKKNYTSKGKYKTKKD